MLGVDEDKIMILSTPFPTILMLGKMNKISQHEMWRK